MLPPSLPSFLPSFFPSPTVLSSFTFLSTPLVPSSQGTTTGKKMTPSAGSLFGPPPTAPLTFHPWGPKSKLGSAERVRSTTRVWW
jgi:hypothetical protein